VAAGILDMKGIHETAVTEASPQPAMQPPLDRQQGGTLVYAPFVRVMTVVIIAVVVAMLALIYVKWATIREPSSAVVVIGDQTHDGARIEVSGYSHTWTAVLDEDNHYGTPVLLDPGRYTIKVTHKNNVLLSTDFVVDSLRGCQYILSPAVEIVGPPSATRDVQLTLECDQPASRQQLTLPAAKGFHQTAYLAPGEYRATASDNGQVISRDVFTVQMSHPLTVKLGQSAQQ
jgi:hypothetical protein